MYIFVFVFMLMGVLGLYTQMFTLQAAKQYANQSAIGETMLLYHNVSNALAHFSNVASLSDGSFCYQTYGAVANACASKITIGGNNQTSLPTGYAPAFAFQSVIYGVSGQKFVLTFVAPPSAGKVYDPVVSPALGFSVIQIFQQMKNTKVSPLTYGVVRGSTFYTKMMDKNPTTGSLFTITYPVLSTIGLLDGTVGFLSPI